VLVAEVVDQGEEQGPEEEMEKVEAEVKEVEAEEKEVEEKEKIGVEVSPEEE